MKIVSIRQYPTQHIHDAWIKSITNKDNKSIYYIPLFFIKAKLLNKLIWYNRILNQFFSLFRIFNMPSADVYLVDGFKAILPALINKGNKKIILINSDTFLSTYSKQNFIVRLIYKWYITHVDYFICTSKMMVEQTSQFSDKPKYQVYPFYDNVQFKDASCSIQSSNLCSISTAKFCKRPDIMIEAFHKFRKKYPNAKLFVCDGGTYGGEGLNESLEFIKKQPNVVTPGLCNPIPYLKKSGLYINTSQHESFGVNILEAMVAGIPPVISKFCGAKDLVEQVDSSLVCDLDSQEFANRLIELHQNKKKKLELGKKCRIVAKKHTRSYSINEFRKVIELITQDIKTKI